VWFSRCWILQEIALSQEIRLLCGHIFLEWKDLLDLSTFIIDNTTSVRVRFKDHNVVEHLGYGHAIGHLNLLKQMISRRNPGDLAEELIEFGGNFRVAGSRSKLLLTLVNGARSYQATDERDKIYSLLGILNEMLPTQNENERFPIDLNCSAEVVLYTAACRCLQQNSSLVVLSLVEDCSLRHFDGLPAGFLIFLYTQG
jgi:hypothetical protein